MSNDSKSESHIHSWWHLLTTTAGPVWKCDCGAVNEPRPWWKFWG